MEASVLFQNMRSILIYRRENRVEKRGEKKIKSNRVYFIHGMLYKFIIIHMRIVNGLISFMVGWMHAFSQFILLVESLQIFNCNSLLLLYFHNYSLILLLSRHYYVRAKLTFNNVEC
jgi:hypothetical protein